MQRSGSDLHQQIVSFSLDLIDLQVLIGGSGQRLAGAAVEAGARRLVERLAIALEGSLLVRYGDPAVADAFSASRLGGDWGHSFGTLPEGLELASIVQRHRPPA